MHTHNYISTCNFQLRFASLPDTYRERLVHMVGSQVPHMNVFCLHNTLWGLARMEAEVHKIMIEVDVLEEVGEEDEEGGQVESVATGATTSTTATAAATGAAPSPRNNNKTAMRKKKKRSSKRVSLGYHLLKHTVQQLHFFLPTQVGDVMWALGTLKFKMRDASHIDTYSSNRLLAVLSRVLGESN